VAVLTAKTKICNFFHFTLFESGNMAYIAETDKIYKHLHTKQREKIHRITTDNNFR